MNRHSAVAAHLSVLTANLLYGANYSIAKQVMPEFIKPFGFILIRVIVSALLFWLIGIFIRDKKVERGDMGRLVLCAFFGVALNQLLFFKGLELTAPINAALMMTTNPILVLVAAAIIMGERITSLKIAGIITGLTGASLLLLWGKEFSFQQSSVAGDLCVLVNSLSFGVFLIIVRPFMQKYHTLTVMKWVFLYGSIMVLPFGYYEFGEIKWDTFTTATWLGVLYVVIGVTAIAYLLNVYALKKLSSTSVSIYIYLQPLFASLIAISFGQDRINPIHLVSALLIFAGVYFVTKKQTATTILNQEPGTKN